MITKRERAILIAGDTMGDLVTFWGFKSSMGRIWTLLYLSTEPLSASDIATLTGLSSGAVSMGLNDLLQWGIAEKVSVPGARQRHYTAETDVWGIVRHIVQERELRLIGKSRERFREAIALLESIDDATDHDRFAIERLRGLLGLAEIGYSLVETFAKVGMLSLEPIRGALSRRG